MSDAGDRPTSAPRETNWSPSTTCSHRRRNNSRRCGRQDEAAGTVAFNAERSGGGGFFTRGSGRSAGNAVHHNRDGADMSMDILGDDALWEDALGTEENATWETKAVAVSGISGTPASSADIEYRMELYGLGTALEKATSGRAGGAGAVCPSGSREQMPSALRGNGHTFDRLQQAVTQQWRRMATLQSAHDFAQEGSQRAAAAQSSRQPDPDSQDGTNDPSVSPTPSEILTASSIRMMLSMATTFRRSNPAMLGAMCGTLLEVLLEAPPLALAPLCREPDSIEASTFRRVGDFCAELMSSADVSERNHALGLYLALAVSHGAVSGLLEVVRCLLDRTLESDASHQEGTDGFWSAADCSLALPGTDTVAGVEDGTHEDAREQQARISRVLGRLARYRPETGLPLVEERDYVTVVAKIPKRRRTGSCDVVPDNEDNVEWSSLSAATDGEYVYTWHPDMGLVKLGTGLRGTTKDRVYAENSGVGCFMPGCTISAAVPPGDLQVDGISDSSALTADLAARADKEDIVAVERAGDLAGWTTDGSNANASADGEPRLLVHYKWRGLHDVVSFSEDEPVEIPTERTRHAWSRRSEGIAAKGAEEKVDTTEMKLCVANAARVTMEGALRILSSLSGARGESLRLIPGSFAVILRQYLSGCTTSVAADEYYSKGGFLAVVADRLYLQMGCMPSSRFLVMRESDLAVIGIADIPDFVPQGSKVLPSAGGATSCPPNESPLRGDGDSKTEDLEQEEHMDSGVDCRGARDDAGTTRCASVPLCCDGRFLYAVLPSEATGRPSVIAVDPANGFKVAHRMIELHPPVCAPQRNAQPGVRPNGSLDASSPVEEWSWWRRGLEVSVHTYCDGDSFMVCWREKCDATVAGSSWLNAVGKACGESEVDESVQVLRQQARFRLATGECLSVERDVSQVNGRIPSFLADDWASDVIVRCYIRRPSLPSGISANGSHAAELCVCLRRDWRLTPNSGANGPFGWRYVLRSLAIDNFGQTPMEKTNDRHRSDGQACNHCTGRTHAPLIRSREDGAELPVLAKVAAFVLAHLDRISAHYLGWSESKSAAQDTASEMKNVCVPFGYDLTPATFKHLVGLVSTHGPVLLSLPSDMRSIDVQQEVRLYVLCASLRLLRVNAEILLHRRMGVAEFGGAKMRRSLLRCLLVLVEGHTGDFRQRTPRVLNESAGPVDWKVGREIATTEALRLLVEGLDLWYPSQRRQACLLFCYLQAHNTNDALLPEEAYVVMAELLVRACSHQFLLALETERSEFDECDAGTSDAAEVMANVGPGLPPGNYFALGPDALRELSEALLNLATVQSVRAVEVAAVANVKDAVGVEQGPKYMVGRGVLKALASILEMRSALSAQMVLPAGRDNKGIARVAMDLDVDVATVEEKSRLLLEFLLLVLRATCPVLAAACSAVNLAGENEPAVVSGGSVPLVERALREGLVGSLLPSAIAAVWALLNESGRQGLCWSCTGATEALLSSLHTPLVSVVRRLGMLSRTLSGVSIRGAVDRGCLSTVGTTGAGEKGRAGAGTATQPYLDRIDTLTTEQSQIRVILQFGIDGLSDGGYDCVTAGGIGCLASDKMSPHWLSRLDILAMGLGASMVQRSVKGEPQTSDERGNARWLRHPLLLNAGVRRQRPDHVKGDFADGPEESTTAGGNVFTGRLGCRNAKQSEEGVAATDGPTASLQVTSANLSGDETVLPLCRDPASHSARALASAMKRAVREDHGSDQSTNEAVWAAAAAVIHHAGLAHEASEVAKAEMEGRRPSPASKLGVATTGESSANISQTLVRAWRSAQQARIWLHSGASGGRDKRLLVCRASFLLFLKPWALTTCGERPLEWVSSRAAPGPLSLSADVDHVRRMPGTAVSGSGWDCDINICRTRLASELVLQFLLRPDIPVASVTAGHSDVESGSTSTDFAGARDGDPSVLWKVLELRSVRAVVRAKGFLLAEQLIEGTASVQATTEVLRAVADGLSTACLGSGVADGEGTIDEGSEGKDTGATLPAGGVGRERSSGGTRLGTAQEGEEWNELCAGAELHFLSGVRCCDTRSKTQLAEAVEKFLRRATSVLEKGMVLGGSSSSGDGQHRRQVSTPSRAGLRAARVEALRAVCMTYGRDDHGILHRSELLPRVLDSLDDADSLVRLAASKTMQAFYRSVTLVNGDIERGPLSVRDMINKTSPFQQAFISAVRGGLQDIAASETTQSSLLPGTGQSTLTLKCSSSVRSNRVLLEGPLALRTDQAGAVVPHFPLGTRHTLVMWVCIPSETAEGAIGIDERGCKADRLLGAADTVNAPGGITRDRALYVVAEGESCAVRCTPSLSSEFVGTLRAGEDVEIATNHGEWEDHPLVREGRRVRVTWPIKGYASRYTADGCMLLRRKQEPCGRSTTDDDVEGAVRACALYMTPDRTHGYGGGDEGPGMVTDGVPDLVLGRDEERLRLRSVTARSMPATIFTGDESLRKGGQRNVALSGKRRRSAGGILLFKGNEVLLGEEEARDSWNRSGIEVTPAGALRFFVGEGSSSEVGVASANGTLFNNSRDQTTTAIPAGCNRAPEWFHVAVVQDLTSVALFLNGKMCGAGALPSHLQRRARPEYRVSVKEVESAHPYPNSSDDVWEVRVPGASSITVRFDPKSKTEMEYDFVRFYRDQSRTQTWGLDKYHGGRSGSASNWPGVDLPPLVIPADFFLVHFHSDGSINDYGFRLTAEGRYPVFGGLQSDRNASRSDQADDHDHHDGVCCTDVGAWPLYIGQPPPHASPRRTVDGGLIAGVHSWNRPLSAEEVAVVFSEQPPPARPAVDGTSWTKPQQGPRTHTPRDGESGSIEKTGRESGSRGGGSLQERRSQAQIISLAHACCRKVFGRKAFSTVESVRASLRVVLYGRGEKRGWAIRLCQETLPFVEPSVVDDEFRRIVHERDQAFQGSFIMSCLLVVGNVSGVWGNFERNSRASAVNADADRKLGTVKQQALAGSNLMDMLFAETRGASRARVSAREAFSIGSELLSLLRALVTKPGTGDATEAEVETASCWTAWADEMATVVRFWFGKASTLVQALHLRKVAGEHNPFHRTRKRRLRSDAIRETTEQAERVERDLRIGVVEPIDKCSTGLCAANGGHSELQTSAPRDAFDHSMEQYSVDDLDGVVAALCLLGGRFGGMYAGARVVSKLPPEAKSDMGAHSSRGSQALGAFTQSRFPIDLHGGRASGPGAGAEELTVIGLELASASDVRPRTRAAATSERPQMRRNTLARTVQEAVQIARTEVPGLMRPLGTATGSVQPLDVHDELAHDVEAARSEDEASGAARAGAAVGEDGVEHEQRVQDRLTQFLHQQQHRDIAARIATARLGSYVRRRGGWDGPGRLSPDVLIDGSIGSMAATVDSSANADTVAAAARATAAESDGATMGVSGGRGEWVTVASAHGGRGDSPYSATVPINNVALVSVGVPTALVHALMPHAKEFVPQLKALMEVNTDFEGTSYLPRETVSQLRCVVESEHPYKPGENRNWPIVIKGAETIEVSFDPESRFSHPGDQLILTWQTPCGAAGYRRLCPCTTAERRIRNADSSGRADVDEGEQMWPGVRGFPPLTVMAEALSVRFVSVATVAEMPKAAGKESKGAEKKDKAWGFRLTASGREVRRTTPPPQPPSLERAILCDLRARAVKSVATLIEHDEASAILAPLIPAVTAVALEAVPQAGESAGWRTRILESSHPYENGTDESYHVSFEGASRLSIAFDPQTRTETDCDYVAFFKDAAHSDWWGEPRYSGRNGIGNWPGCGNRPPLEIPASRLFIKWKTDNAVTDWGWKMTITAESADVAAVATPPAQLEQRLAGAYALLYEQPKPPKRPPENEFEDFPIAPRVRREAVRNVCADGRETGDDCSANNTSLPTELRPSSSRSSEASCGDEMKGEGEGAGLTTAAHESPATGKGHAPWPRLYVVCMGGVEAFAAPFRGERPGPPLAQLREGATVIAAAQQRDWLKVYAGVKVDPASVSSVVAVRARSAESNPFFTTAVGANPSASFRTSKEEKSVTRDEEDTVSSSSPRRLPPFVWIRQRQDDTIFLIPNSTSGAAPITSPDAKASEDAIMVTIPPGEGDEEDADGGPLVWGVDYTEVGNELGDAKTNVSDMYGAADVLGHDVMSDLRGNAGASLWDFTTKSLCAAAARFGVSALHTVASRWRGGDGKLFSPERFGSFAQFWDFLRLTNVVERGNLQSPVMSALRLRITESVGGTGGGAFGRALVQRALGTLRKLAAQPGTRALARVFETPHPYENNMDMEWKINLPGARRTKIVFDPRSQTEANCDWVSIAHDVIDATAPGVARPRPIRYHGRDGSENFPGFGGRPPLWLDGNRFVARFRSDPSSTDWGVRFTVYGILDDETAKDEDLVGSDEGSDARKDAAAAAAGGCAAILQLDLSCWLLEFLSREARYVPELAARLCDSDSIAVLHDCLKVFCQRRRLRVLRLIASIMAEARLPSACPAPHSPDRGPSDGRRNDIVRPSVDDVRTLFRTIIAFSEDQHVLEREAPVKSTYSQALVQCAVLLHVFLVNNGDHTSSKNVATASLAARSAIVSSPAEVAASATNRMIVARMPAANRNRQRIDELSSSQEVSLNGGPGATVVWSVATMGAVLSDFAQGTIPFLLMLEDFVPILTEVCSITVQSTHPFDRRAIQSHVTIPGATALELRFDPRTEMGEDDDIVIRRSGSGEATGLLRNTVGAADLLHLDGESTGFLGITGGTNEDVLPPISVGDIVARGPDWVFGNEDGADDLSPDAITSGDAGMGVVVALESWAGREGGAARVRWKEKGVGGSTNSDRAAKVKRLKNREEGFEGLYSVRDPTHLSVVKRGGSDKLRRPVIVAGDAVAVEFSPKDRDDEVWSSFAEEDGGPRPMHCFKFDGESTHVDLPSYGGMRLEGDFTLEVWAWLQPGTAKDGKPKCMISRALDQPLLQSRRGTRSHSLSVEDSTQRSPDSVVSAHEGALCSATVCSVVSRNGQSVCVSDTINHTVSGIPETTHICLSAAAMPEAPAEGAAKDDLVLGRDSSMVPGNEEVRTVHISASVEPTATKVPVLHSSGRTAVVGEGRNSPIEGTRLLSPPTSAGGVPEETAQGYRRVTEANANDERSTAGQERPVQWSWVGRDRACPSSGAIENDTPTGRYSLLRRVITRRDNSSNGSRDSDELTGEEEQIEDGDDTCEDTELEEGEDDGETATHVRTRTGNKERAWCVGSDERSSIVVSLSGARDETAAAPATQAGVGSPPNPGVVTSENAYVGLRVMRGPHWTYRQQDGGVSKLGTVVGTRRLDGAEPPDGDNPIREGWTKVRWDNGRANSYETGFNGKFSISFADAIPGCPRDLVVSSVTDRSISICWAPPERQGRPSLHSYVIYRDGVEIATVTADTLTYTNVNRMRGWPYSYSVAARGLSGESRCCAPVEACTATQDDRRTQLALWVGEQGELHFAMGNERGKGVLLNGGVFAEGVWTHLAVTVTGRKVHVVVDGKCRATGNFVGRRLSSRAPSPARSDLPSTAEQPWVEPLRLGSRGARDYWPGRLCDARVWDGAAAVIDLRRRMICPPSASLLRTDLPRMYRFTAPADGDAFQRLRVHAPLPDHHGGAAGGMVGRSARKAYYEVTLRSGGCMQIGWALPSCCPASPNLGVGDDDLSWACDGMRAMKWHGTTSPVSSPYAHGVPYGNGWRWRSGDVIGCAVDLDAGEMSFSHNGLCLGRAFRKARAWGTQRYRVVAKSGLLCQVAIDPASPVVEIFSPGTVLEVLQIEHSTSGGVWRFRTAEGWVSQRLADDPDAFLLERLHQDTCPFASAGAGPERCVFVNALRTPSASADGSEGNFVAPDAKRHHVRLNQNYAELIDVSADMNCTDEQDGESRAEVTAATSPGEALRGDHDSSPVWNGMGHNAETEMIANVLPSSSDGCWCATVVNAQAEPPIRTALTRGVDIGDADAVTFMIELFVPAACSGWKGEDWRWGVTLGDFDVYLSTKPYRTLRKERDNGGNVGDERKESDVDQRISDGWNGQTQEDGHGVPDGALHMVIDGPGGLYYQLPVSPSFIGRWMNLRIVAHRSGESLLLFSPGSNESRHYDSAPIKQGVDTGSDGGSNRAGGKSVSYSGDQLHNLKCTFSNPRFFRGDRVGCVGLYSKRCSAAVRTDRRSFPFRARHAIIVLGTAEESFAPPLPRLRELEALVASERKTRLAEPAARPLLVFARRLRRLWSGDVSPAAPAAVEVTDSGKSPAAKTQGTCASDLTSAGAGAVAGRNDSERGSSASTLTIWEPLLPPGRVALGTAACLSRTNGTIPASNAGCSDGDSTAVGATTSCGSIVENGSVQRRCLTAWEHPALQTPVRFDAVPLSPAMPALATEVGDGEGLWAWAPVPRSDAYLAIGLTFTTSPQPPPLTAARCVLRELVKDADSQKCKVVALTRGQKRSRRSERNGGSTAGGKDCYCNELILVKEMGVCIPKDGSAWGLSPRVVIGDPGTNPAQRTRPWDGLMPTFSCLSGQSMVINLGRVPFRYPMEGYRPLVDMAHADARFVLQVYRGVETMWDDVRSSDGLLDGSSLPRAPDLVGRWLLRATADGTGNARELQNDVFSAACAPCGGGSSNLTRLPAARAGGLMAAAAGVPLPPPLRGAQEVWGFSIKVIPQFPSDVGNDSTHPWLKKRFEAFLSLVWGEQAQAQSVNAQLVRYINATATQRGVLKDSLLSCDWSVLRPSQGDLADWPLLHSITSATVDGSPTKLGAPRGASPIASPAGSTAAGVEERKESQAVFEESLQDGDGGDEGNDDECMDEWVVATPNAPPGGVALHAAPLTTGPPCWRLAPGHASRLGPRCTPLGTTNEKGAEILLEAEEVGWRRVDGLIGQWSWLAPTSAQNEPEGRSTATVEHCFVDRYLIDGFTSTASCRKTSGRNGGRRVAGAHKPIAVEDFWVSITQGVGASVGGGGSRMLSPFSAFQLLGDSDALLLSAVDLASPTHVDMSDGSGDDKSLLVVGKWKIGLMTDTLTVSTRTSGLTRIAPSYSSGMSANGRASDTAAPVASSDSTATSCRRGGPVTPVVSTSSLDESLPALVDGLVFGFRAADGLLVVARAFPTTHQSRARGWGAQMDPVEPRAVAYLGNVDEGAEVAFSVIDAGEDVMFSCREVGGRCRSAVVRARCRDNWGRGRVAFGVRAASQDSSTGWVRVVSQAHGATVRSGMSIDADAVVGCIPCGTVVPYDTALIYTSPGAQDRVGIDPVVRYRCIATDTTPAGWISERGRYANHPYRICEQVRKRPRQAAHFLSAVTIGAIAPAPTGERPNSRERMADASNTTPAVIPLPRMLQPLGDPDRHGSGQHEWQQRLHELPTLSARFQLIQRLNRGVSQALPFVDLSQGELPWSLAALLSRSRHLIFSALKLELWYSELARTARPPSQDGSGWPSPPLELRLSRGRAARRNPARSSGPRDQEGRAKRSLFGQAFTALRDAPTEAFHLRPGEALYNTIFVGEHAHDAGGPYRESFAEYCAELQSDALPLFIRCPNAVNNVGINREKWIPSPVALSADKDNAKMLHFLGRLMGVAIRSEQPLDLDLPSIVWKQLVRSPITMDDVEAIDLAYTRSLVSIRNIHVHGVQTEEEFRYLGLGKFTVSTVDGGHAELPGSQSSSDDITFANRRKFVAMAETFKKQELSVPVDAIRRGLGSVIPARLLRLFSWNELEVLVCGRKEVDVDLLESCAEYSLCSRQDSHVAAFWDVLRSFSSKEKALFLRFTWGRSRLPMSIDQLQQPFKLQSFNRSPADSYLPVAHTCFFSLELPRYSSREILEEKLRYAIHNCQAIDADDTSVGRSAANMGWDEEP